ncbi:MAG: pilin [Francisellaceae bacterium]|nr:pilin [Francisellaceae bacterium]
MVKFAKGFSLIELMIVIAIIGLLAVIAIPNYQIYIKKSKVVEAIGMLESVKPQMAEYFNSNGTCPSSISINGITYSGWGPDANFSQNIQNFYYGACLGSVCPCSGSACKCILQALLSSALGGGKITLIMLLPNTTSNSTNSIQFVCGFWDTTSGQAGTSQLYAPSSCNATNLSSL